MLLALIRGHRPPRKPPSPTPQRGPLFTHPLQIPGLREQYQSLRESCNPGRESSYIRRSGQINMYRAHKSSLVVGTRPGASVELPLPAILRVLRAATTLLAASFTDSPSRTHPRPSPLPFHFASFSANTPPQVKVTRGLR